MTLRTSDIIQRDDYGDIVWDELTQEERELAWARMREKEQKRARKVHAVKIAAALFVAFLIAVLLAFSALPARAHDYAAWVDPLRDEWYRSLQVPSKPGRLSVSCCDWNDANSLNPDEVRQDTLGQWWVDLGDGYVPVPPDRVVKFPTSIDGLPYVFLMFDILPGNPGRIRCFVPPVPTY